MVLFTVFAHEQGGSVSEVQLKLVVTHRELCSGLLEFNTQYSLLFNSVHNHNWVFFIH